MSHACGKLTCEMVRIKLSVMKSEASLKNGRNLGAVGVEAMPNAPMVYQCPTIVGNDRDPISAALGSLLCDRAAAVMAMEEPHGIIGT